MHATRVMRDFERTLIRAREMRVNDLLARLRPRFLYFGAIIIRGARELKGCALLFSLGADLISETSTGDESAARAANSARFLRSSSAIHRTIS